MSNLRIFLKRHLPSIIRRPLRAALNYSQRVGRWGVILWQVRGQSITDEAKLLLSAIASPILALKQLMSWQDPILLFDTNVQVPGIGRFQLRGHTDDLWHVLPWREKEIIRELNNRLRQNSIFVDAGANIGVYTILASRLVGDGGEVIAIEMVPDTMQILRHHIELNNCTNVVLIESALSDKVGDEAVVTLHAGKCGQASISPEKFDITAEQVRVETTTLDCIFHNHSDIDLLKMDLEGVEAQVLRGSQNTLPKLGAIIYETAHDESNEVTNMVRAAGFTLQDLTGKDYLGFRA